MRVSDFDFEIWLLYYEDTLSKRAENQSGWPGKKKQRWHEKAKLLWFTSWLNNVALELFVMSYFGCPYGHF